MRILHLTCRVLAYVTGGAILAVVCSPLILAGLVCLAGMLVCIAIAFGAALAVAAVCALILESLVGLPFWLGMCLAGTGAVLTVVGMLVSGFTDEPRKSSSSGDPELRAGCRAPATPALWFLAGWLVGQRHGE